jgi:hypothetical protein
MTYQSAWLSVMVPPDIDMGLTSGDIVARWVKFFAARWIRAFRRHEGKIFHCQVGQAFIIRRAKLFGTR